MLVGDQSTAEDVVQDAFLGLYGAWDRVRDPDAVLGYLRTAVVNGTRSVHRSRGRARLLRAQHDPPVWSAEAAVMDGEDRRAVLAAIATLPQRQREVLALKYYLDLSERDVAAIMRVSRGTVAATSSRALLAVIGASVALPRLLTGAAGKPGNSASALAHDPPFQVIVTSTLTRSTSLLVRTPAGSLPVQLGWLAADADGGVIAFSGQRSGGAFVVGAVIGNQVKQWSVAEKEASIGSVSVTSAGDKIAFITQYNGPGSHFAAMVLATGSAPGSLLTRAKTAGSYDYPRKDWYMFAVAISPDGTWVYVVTRPIDDLGVGKLPTTLTAYRASRQGAPVTIATWAGGEPALLPIGTRLFAWMYYIPRSASAPSPASTAYLINPATRTKTAVQLPGLPSGQYAGLAW